MKLAIVSCRRFKNADRFPDARPGWERRAFQDGACDIVEVVGWADLILFAGLGDSFWAFLAKPCQTPPRVVVRLSTEDLYDAGSLECVAGLTDVVVGSWQDARRLRALTGDAPAFRLHVVTERAGGVKGPEYDVGSHHLSEILHACPPMQLTSTWKAWRRVALMAEGPCAVVAPDYETASRLCDFLHSAYGLSTFPFDPTTIDASREAFGTVVLMQALSGAVDRIGLVETVRERLEPSGRLIAFEEAASTVDELPEARGAAVFSEALSPRFGACRVERLGNRWLVATNAAAESPVCRAVSVPGDSDPLVSVIIPVWNDQRRIARAISSVLAGTYGNFEIVVVDDGSTDATAQVVKKFDDTRVRYLYKAHSGRPQTRNLGIHESRGEFIAWLDSDDAALPNRLRWQVDAFRDEPSADVVHTDAFMMDAADRVIEMRSYTSFTKQQLPALLIDGLSSICPILNTSVMIRKRCYDLLGGYDESFLRAQDYEFWVRAAASAEVAFKHVALPLVSVSARIKWSQELAELTMTNYRRLALKMVEAFPAEALFPDMVRQLRSEEREVVRELGLGRALVSAALAFGAPATSALFVEGVECLSEAVRKCQSPVAWNLLGVAAVHRGQIDEARDAFERALILDSSNTDARVNLARCTGQ